MTQIRAVLFDAGNTLIWLDHPFIVETLREHGVETTTEQLMEAEYASQLLMDELARASARPSSPRAPARPSAACWRTRPPSAAPP